MSFCSSLRRRPEWSTVPAKLLAIPNPKWAENTFETHDIAIPLPRRGQPGQPEYFLIILISASDLQPLETTMDRIKRLYHSRGGRYVGVVFLLNEKSPKRNGVFDYMNLQASLLSSDFDMPILPLFNVDALQDTLFSFQRDLVHSREAQGSAPKPNPITSLLPYCSTNPPIPEHSRNVLSEVYQSIPHLAQDATTLDGQQKLQHWLPNTAVAEDIVGFWEQEFVVD